MNPCFQFAILFFFFFISSFPFISSEFLINLNRILNGLCSTINVLWLFLIHKCHYHASLNISFTEKIIIFIVHEKYVYKKLGLLLYFYIIMLIHQRFIFSSFSQSSLVLNSVQSCFFSYIFLQKISWTFSLLFSLLNSCSGKEVRLSMIS